MRRDSIRYSSRRIRGRTLQTHVGEIPSVKSSHAASVSTATTSVTTTTTSECRSWLSQADRCRCEQGYSRFPHHASSPGRGRSQGGDTFAAGFIRWSKNARSKLTDREYYRRLKLGERGNAEVLADNLHGERDWGSRAEPNPELNGRSLSMSMGEVLGGGSSVNANSSGYRDLSLLGERFHVIEPERWNKMFSTKSPLQRRQFLWSRWRGKNCRKITSPTTHPVVFRPW